MDVIELATACKKAAEAGSCVDVIKACDYVLGPAFQFKATVEEWSFVVAGRPGEPPAKWMPRIMVNVSGHPVYSDGSKFMSEAICSIDPENRLVVTSRGVYVLGEVDETFRDKVFGGSSEQAILAKYAEILKGVA